jgi:hypothetical protein
MVKAATIVVGALVLVAAIIVIVRRGTPPDQPNASAVCATTPGPAGVYVIDPDQARYATSIAAAARRLGLADHAVTIALATALQESNLHNLPAGDLDSIGLFQQRPSQGWGTPDQIRDPRYAIETFYQHLVKVPQWQTLPVTEAAQAVQRSAAPDAYAQWEREARALAQALTGQVPAGFTCQLPGMSGSAQTQEAAAALARDLGTAGIAQPVPAATGWTVALWLVGHADQYHLQSVAYAGRRWTPTTARWDPDPTADAQVHI